MKPRQQLNSKSQFHTYFIFTNLTFSIAPATSTHEAHKALNQAIPERSNTNLNQDIRNQRFSSKSFSESKKHKTFKKTLSPD